MAEDMPYPETKVRQLRRSLTEKVLKEAQSNTEWRRLLLEDPELAMREVNFSEIEQCQQLRRDL